MNLPVWAERSSCRDAIYELCVLDRCYAYQVMSATSPVFREELKRRARQAVKEGGIGR